MAVGTSTSTLKILRNFDSEFLPQLTLIIEAAKKGLSPCGTSSMACGIRNSTSSPSEGDGSATPLDLLQARGFLASTWFPRKVTSSGGHRLDWVRSIKVCNRADKVDAVQKPGQ